MTHARRYLELLRRWLWLMVLGTIVAGGATYLVGRSLTPIYRATATLLINQVQVSTGSASINDILTSERLARTYGELLKKRPVVEEVISDLRLAASYEQVARLIDVRPVRDTQLITLAVENADPQLAADIANALANTFIARQVEEQLGQTSSTREVLLRQIADVDRQIKATSDALEQQRRAVGDQQTAQVGLLQSQLGQHQATYAQLLRSQQDMALAEAKAASTVRLAEQAVRTQDPVRPQVMLNSVIAAVVGLALAVGIALAIEYLDDAVKTPELVEQASGLHTLGAVALTAGSTRRRAGYGDDKERLLVSDDARSPVTESFRMLRTSIEFAQLGKPVNTLLITSANPGEGKSTVALNLAAVIAQSGRRVLLVDADLRRPTLHRSLGLENRDGLTTLLARPEIAFEMAVQESGVPGLAALTSGPIPPNPAELLGSERMEQLLTRLHERYDLIVLDTPPVLAVTDPVVMASRVDGVVVVADAGKTSADSLRRAREALGRASANVLGVVLNKLTARSGGYYYYYYRSYYGEDGAKGQKDGNASLREKVVVGRET